MDERVPRSQECRFKQPLKAFDGMGVADVADILTASSDVSLILEPSGMIVDVAFATDSIFEEVGKSWVGQLWRDTVTNETQIKIDALLKDAADDKDLMWRQVNHFTQQMGDIPVNYATFSLDKGRAILAVGRNLHHIAEEQRRLMNAQMAMERGYSRLQASEMRYRQLFQTSSEAMLIIDCDTLKVVEANTHAIRLFSAATNKLIGRRIKDLLKSRNIDLTDLLTQATVTGGTLENIEIRDDDNSKVDVSTVPLRSDEASLLVLCFKPTLTEDSVAALPENRIGIHVMQSMPDGFLLTQPDGQIIAANTAFCDIVQVASAERLWGEQFDRLFERSDVDCSVLFSNLKQHKVVKRFATSLKSVSGLIENVEINGIAINHNGTQVFGFIIRQIGLADRPTSIQDGVLPYSVDQLSSLVGHMSLKEVVRETTTVIERLCIEAALELTNDNRAAAAQLLGLSRQSLYDKLGRYKLDK